MDDISAYSVDIDSELIDTDIDEIDLYAERTVEDDTECDIEFE